MPELVRRDHDLPTLRVRLSGEGPDGPTAGLDVLRGWGEARPVTEISTRSLGLADHIRSARDVSESRFRLADTTIAMIVDALHDLDADADAPAYWLELPSPRGYLHLVPWERLLSPELGRPLLRLPNYTLRPKAPGSTLRVVLVAGRTLGFAEFDVAYLLDELTTAWTAAVDRDVIVDVFVDADSYREVRYRLRDQPGVTVHDRRRPPDSLPDARGDDAMARPWLDWVGASLGGTATDVIHLVGHGHISGDRGALVLPAAPVDSTADRFIGPVLVNEAMSRLGAWSLLLSGVPDNHCRPGLRDLADAASQARSGVVLLHEATAAEPAAELDPALRMVFGGLPPERSLPGITCWSHPSFVAFPASRSSSWQLCDPDGTSSLITDAAHDALTWPDTPTWVAAGARALETLQAEWTPADGSRLDPQAEAALKAVSQLFDEHVRTHASTNHPIDPGATS
jgi:hypothetical protein